MAGFRQKTAYWLRTSALALLAISILFFIWMWVRAYAQEDVPQGPWGQYEGNHGPWYSRDFLIPGNNRYGLRWLWWQVLNMQYYAFAMGVLSMFFKPSKKAFIVSCSAFVLGSLFFVTHYWLVD